MRACFVCTFVDVVSICVNIYVYTLVYVDVVNVCVFIFVFGCSMHECVFVNILSVYMCLHTCVCECSEFVCI